MTSNMKMSNEVFWIIVVKIERLSISFVISSSNELAYSQCFKIWILDAIASSKVNNDKYCRKYLGAADHNSMHSYAALETFYEWNITLVGQGELRRNKP